MEAEEEFAGVQASKCQLPTGQMIAAKLKDLILTCSLITAGETLLAEFSLLIALVKLWPQKLPMLLGR